MLCLDVRSSRCGFAVFDDPDRLIDFGITSYAGQQGRLGSMVRKVFHRLVHLHSPSLVVFRLPPRHGDKRNDRSKMAVKILRTEAGRQSIPMRFLGRDRIKRFFKAHGLSNKKLIASYLARRFPNLESRVPSSRKKWQPEKQGMCLFDAVSAAVLVRSEGEGQAL